MAMVVIRKIGTVEYDRNQINNTGSFSVKPTHRGTWGTLGHAKAHITQIFNTSDQYADAEHFTSVLELYMSSEFVVFSDDFTLIETIPVKDYFLEKIKDFVINGTKAKWCEDKRRRKLAQEYLTSIGIDVIMVTEAQKRVIELEKLERAELARLKAKYEK